VREKKKECWQAFCEENGDKDPWEIVKWAKDLWHLKATMGDLTDIAGISLKTDNEKKNGLIRDHFGWGPEGRNIEIESEGDRFEVLAEQPQGRTPIETEGAGEATNQAESREEARSQAEGKGGATGRITGLSQEERERLVRKALVGTSNKSAPRPDGIGYKLIKAALGMKLGKELVREVAENLRNGRIPKEWQHSKVVKPGKDHSKTKGWRPINLINCISKLGEKVVADRLQESSLLHRYQFGSVKGRSATEVALRVITRA